MSPKEIKKRLYQELQKQVEQRITNARKAMQAAQESRDNETKSSVGDKYETGRAMMQLEQERNEVQMIKAINLKNELDQIDMTKSSEVVELGSLVSTNKGQYFIAIGLGKISIDEQKYFVISKDAPIGKVLLGKKQGDTVQWQANSIKIESIA